MVVIHILESLIVKREDSYALNSLAGSLAAAVAVPALFVSPYAVSYTHRDVYKRQVLANVNAGLLYIMAITSVGVYGVIVAGWASNSKYAFLGALRASAQMLSYELAIGFVLVTVLLVSGSLNMSEIVHVQNRGWFADKGLTFLSLSLIHI